MDIILINGPKGVGKDTAARAAKQPGWSVAPVTRALKLATLTERGLDTGLLDVYDTNGVKDVPLPELAGLSFREAVIDKSKRIGRSEIVKGWVAQLPPASVTVVPDCRFFEEFIAAVDHVGGKNVYVMRIHRPGHTWDGDIGRYVYADKPVFGHREVDVTNDVDEEYFKLETSVFMWGFAYRRKT